MCKVQGKIDFPKYREVLEFLNITKTYLYNFATLLLYLKLGFTGVYIIFVFLLKNIDCGIR